ncbi:MAG: hypothetical protein KF764_00885 [Labilithrix sp.]|nr:hypothetical protein [Labilithrix sp.]
MYSRADRGEHNIGAFLRERPELVARLGLLDLDRDDADLALQLAPAIGQYKRRVARDQAGERGARAELAARALAASARRRLERVELDPALLLGDLLADGSRKFIGFELTGVRLVMLRHMLIRARGALRGFPDVAAHVNEQGLHLTWRGGRGGLNLRPQAEERGAAVLHVDLRPARRSPRADRSGPVLLAEVLANLGFF